MRNLFYLLRKEFLQIFRNPTILRLIIIMPMMQLILIPLAADFEVKHVNLSVVDLDHSNYSQRLIQKMTSSGYFSLVQYTSNYSEALKNTNSGNTDLIITIPLHFEQDLVRENASNIHLGADAVNGVKAGLGTAYASQIIADFNREIRAEWAASPRANEVAQIEIRTMNWYNSKNDYHLFMVPGILAILVTMVGSFLAALNIVAEKEVGTIEQLNVTPIKKYQFILGKLIPFWVLGLVSITIGLGIAYLVFGLIPLGSFGTIYLFSMVYLLSVLGIGLLISTFVETQQQATLFAFFFMMIFILMGGLYTPIESMPEWAQWIAACNPPAYFIKVIRAIFIKGSTIYDLRKELLYIAGFAVFFNSLAIMNYRKTSG